MFASLLPNDDVQGAKPSDNNRFKPHLLTNFGDLANLKRLEWSLMVVLIEHKKRMSLKKRIFKKKILRLQTD